MTESSPFTIENITSGISALLIRILKNELYLIQVTNGILFNLSNKTNVKKNKKTANLKVPQY